MARPRGVLTTPEARAIDKARERKAAAEEAYRVKVVAALTRGASFGEVAKHTGLSPDTLQRWKRESDQTATPDAREG